MSSRVLSTILLSPPHSPSKSTVEQTSPSLPTLSVRVRVRKGCVKCRAVSDGSQGPVDGTVYQGTYGPWTVEQSDVREVILYRSGLVTAAASFVAASSVAFLPESFPLSEAIKQNHDFFYLLGTGGLGLSLLLIHIYITEIKRTLQALWALGVVGSLATYAILARPAGDNLVQYVIDNPSAVWFVGPLFAALTGLVFKEGLCYGKLEAALLTFIIPAVLLGHLVMWLVPLSFAVLAIVFLTFNLAVFQELGRKTGLMDDGVKHALLGTWMGLFLIFAGRKFTQPIKDDIGDKSVFMFKSLSEDGKKAVIEKLEQEKRVKSQN